MRPWILCCKLFATEFAWGVYPHRANCFSLPVAQSVVLVWTSAAISFGEEICSFHVWWFKQLCSVLEFLVLALQIVAKKTALSRMPLSDLLARHLGLYSPSLGPGKMLNVAWWWSAGLLKKLLEGEMPLDWEQTSPEQDNRAEVMREV